MFKEELTMFTYYMIFMYRNINISHMYIYIYESNYMCVNMLILFEKDPDKLRDLKKSNVQQKDIL